MKHLKNICYQKLNYFIKLFKKNLMNINEESKKIDPWGIAENIMTKDQNQDSPTDQPLSSANSDKHVEQECLKPLKVNTSRQIRFSKKFPDIAQTDDVIKSYHCALVGDILIQGFLYITPNWFCFYSKLLGKKCIKIPVGLVVNITKKKTAIIIPNAVGVVTEHNKYLFGSLISRDSTYQVMIKIWQAKRGLDDKDALENLADELLLKQLPDLRRSSSEASFCSDYETSYQSSDHNNPTLDNSPTTAEDFDHEPQPTDSRVATENPVHPVAKQPEIPDNDNTQVSKRDVNEKNNIRLTTANLGSLFLEFKETSKTVVCLVLSLVLLAFLLVLAVILSYRIIGLETLMDTKCGCHQLDDTNAFECRDTSIRHQSNMRDVEQVLKMHIDKLDELKETITRLHDRLATGRHK